MFFLRWFLVLSLACFLGLGGWWIHFWFLDEHSLSEEVCFRVAKGSSLNQVICNLHELRLVKHPFLFRLGTFLTGARRHIRAGEFCFQGDWTYGELFEDLLKGQRRVVKVFLPEGFNLWQIADLLDGRFQTSSQEWLLLLNQRPPVPSDWGWNLPSWEGFLYPETYHLDSFSTAQDFLNTVLKQFLEEFGKIRHLYDPAKGRTLYETVILASIVEKETGSEVEKPLVASVFLNRLKKSMKLQADPTVVYGVWPLDEDRIRRKHLQDPNPYNTYVNYGLPPTPICSPTQSSLSAVWAPAETNYLYFVVDEKEGHYFSETLAEHEKAVKRYVNSLEMKKNKESKED